MDIIDGIAKVRLAFKAANMEAPAAIVLRGHEDGMRFLSSVRQQDIWTAEVGSPQLGKRIIDRPIAGDDYMGIEIMGITVMWPAACYLDRDGKKILT